VDEYDDEEDNISRDGGYVSDPELGTAKRSYHFKDEGASPTTHNTTNKRYNRAQSAKGGRDGYNERDLRSTKMTTDDYIENEQ